MANQILVMLSQQDQEMRRNVPDLSGNIWSPVICGPAGPNISEIFGPPRKYLVPPRNARVKTCIKWGVHGAEVAYLATDEQSER